MSITEHELPGVVTFPEEWVPQPVQDPEPKPPTEAEQVAALLFRSAELIETHGWVTGKEQDALGACKRTMSFRAK